MQQNDFIEASPLGKESAYVNEYSPQLLFPIPRNKPWHPSSASGLFTALMFGTPLRCLGLIKKACHKWLWQSFAYPRIVQILLRVNRLNCT